MKNVLLSISIALFLLNGSARAQLAFISENGKDTARGTYSTGAEFKVYNPIKSNSTNPVYLKWSVIPLGTPGGSKFDAGWDTLGTGICDNVNCYTHLVSNPILQNGTVNKSDVYNNNGFAGTPHDLHVIFVPNNPPNGSSAVVRINARDTVSNTTRTLTFIATKGSLGVTTINSADDIIVYPIPARESINVVYDEHTGIRTVAIYNLIGKLMGPIYKPAVSGSAKINIEDMPTGVYFMRLIDGNGRVVATRRFIRQ